MGSRLAKNLVKEHRIETVETSSSTGEGFRAFLGEIDTNAMCEKCGGLPYDIVFVHGDIKFKFCLYKIQRGGKILAETDYKKLYEYTREGGEMMSLRKKRGS